MRQPPPLAKLSPPRPRAVFLRTRLFRWLDRAGAPVLWVTGPPGAGKTTLVASYLATRKLRAFWYQVDEGDADIAAFFYHLRLAAARAAPWRRRPLPLLSPEYLRGLPTFTRRYFRNLYDRLRPPFVVVFDNYHEVPADAPLHAVVRDGLAQLPPGGRVIVTSRSRPPSALARLRATQTIDLLGGDDLRLTREEAAGIARLRGPARPSRDLLQALHERADGWVAGLVLLLERLAREGLAAGSPDRPSPEAIFDYFAGEILERTDRETRDFLLETAVLPKMTGRMAEALTGLSRAARILGDLTRKNSFVTARAEAEPVYEYHPLFREFLLSRAREALPPPRWLALQRSAAAVLDAADQVEHAARLLREAGDWPGLVRVIQRQAAALLAQGRSRTLEEWLRSLPAEVLEQGPWLHYWLGACRLPFGPLEAREHFAKAFDLFQARQDRAGLLLAWARAVETFIYEWGDFRPLDRWIAALEDLLARQPGFPSAEIERRVAFGMFTALMYRQPQHPDLPVWAERVRAIALSGPDVSFRMTVGHQLLLYYAWWTGDLARAADLVEALRPVARSPAIPPLTLIVWRSIEATYHWMTAAHEACLTAVEEGLETARSTGVHLWDFMLCAQGVRGSLTAGDLRRADQYLKRMASALDPSHGMNVCLYHDTAGIAALWRADAEGALRHAQTALAQARETGMPFAQAMCHITTAWALFEQGDREQAAEHLADARRIGRAMKSTFVDYLCLLPEAMFALDRGEEAAGINALGEALAIGRAQGFLTHTRFRPAVMARLCATALERGIEVEHVRHLVRRRGLVLESPPLDVEQWPWPVKIFTLGRFEVHVDGQPVVFAGKSQRKRLALLKALIALGGRDVQEDHLAEALWPDAEGDAARQALATTLHRLRRLLRHERVIKRQDGQLTLDSQVCWVDAWALERLLGEAEAEGRRGQTAEQTGLTERALALYQGPFLGADDTAPWMAPLRTRLRSKVLRHLGELGRHWEQAGEWEQAVACYERGLEFDDCAETLYRPLMAAYQRLGRRAEAVSAYHRCRARLAAVLGIEPSPETQALYTLLSSAQGAPRLRLA